MAEATLDTSEVDDWIRNALRELPRAASNRVRRKAVDAATRFYEARLKAETPTFDTGALKRSMTRTIRAYTRRGRRGSSGSSKYFLGVVGPDYITGPHAHLVEFGTAPRRTLRGHNRGEMPEMPFFENIFRVSLEGGRQIIESTVRAELSREFERIGQGQRAAGGE